MKILLVHDDMAQFVKRDYFILSAAHEVKAFHFPSFRDSLLRMAMKLPSLWREVAWSDVTFS